MQGIRLAPLAILLAATTAMAQTGAEAPTDHATRMAAAGAQREADVARRGKGAAPFDLAATTHVFTKTRNGGVQRVVTKKSDDREQQKLVRQHLKKMRKQFMEGNFSDPVYIHGQNMPGVAELRAAPPGQLSISYQNVKNGGQLIYTSANPALVKAIHQWFGAQRLR